MAIRKLWPGERENLKNHLLRLNREDRRMRFFGSVSDDFIHTYCDRINWLRSTILGCFVEGELRGVTELMPTGDAWPSPAELALTVEGPFQDRGIGTELLQKVLIMARNRFIGTVYMICLLENKKMQHVARKSGADLVFHEGEVEGKIWPPWPSYLSLVEEVATEGQALFRAAFELPPSRAHAALDEAV